MSSRRLDLTIAAALALAILAVFLQVRDFGFVNYDDDLFVSANANIRAGWSAVPWAFTTGYAANWFPLTWISYIVGYQLYGLDPGWTHLTNVILHAIAAIAFYAAFRSLTKAVWPSAFVAFVFALHPLHVEPVAWISERKEVLSGLFWALSLVAYARYAARPGWRAYLLLIAAFTAGLMSKPMIVTLPFVLLLLDYWPLRRVAIREKIPLFALSAIASFITWRVQRGGGAVLEIAQLPLTLRIENAVIAYAQYLRQFFLPGGLAAIYPFHPTAMAAAIATLVLVAITAAAILQRSKRPYLLIGWLWFLGTLVPVIGLVQVGIQGRADRYTYIPILGLAIAIAWLVPRPAILALAVPVWIAISYLQTGYWHDSVTLFRHTVEVTGDNWMALSTLSNALIAENRIAEAEPYLRESLRLQPNLAMTRVNLATALSKRGDFRAAEEQYRIAVRLAPEDPDAQEGLGVVLIEQNRLDEAKTYLDEAVRLRPDHADSHYNLGRLYGLAGKAGRAIAEFSEALRLNPNDSAYRSNLAIAHFNYGSMLANQSRYEEAIAHFKQVDSEEARRMIAECERLRKGGN